MSRFSRRHTLWITALLLLGLLAFERLLWTPLARAGRQQTERLAAARETVAQGEFITSRHAALVRDWETLQARSLPGEMPSAEETLLHAVARWARAAGVRPLNITPRWRAHAEGFQALECRATVQGRFVELARFLAALEQDPLALRVEQYDITARDERGRELLLNVRFSGLQLPSAERDQP